MPVCITASCFDPAVFCFGFTRYPTMTNKNYCLVCPVFCKSFPNDKWF